MSRIRLGIWGLGRMGFTHCRCFSAEADMHELVTGCDIEQVKMCRHHPYRRRADWQGILRYGGGQLNNWGSHIIDHALPFIFKVRVEDSQA